MELDIQVKGLKKYNRTVENIEHKVKMPGSRRLAVKLYTEGGVCHLPFSDIAKKEIKNLKKGDKLQVFKTGIYTMQIYDSKGRQLYHRSE